jgi:hypothetical protein
MQPTYTAEAEAYREKVQAFLAEKLPTNWRGIGRLAGDELREFVTNWRAILYDAGHRNAIRDRGNRFNRDAIASSLWEIIEEQRQLRRFRDSDSTYRPTFHIGCVHIARERQLQPPETRRQCRYTGRRNKERSRTVGIWNDREIACRAAGGHRRTFVHAPACGIE